MDSFSDIYSLLYIYENITFLFIFHNHLMTSFQKTVQLYNYIHPASASSPSNPENFEIRDLSSAYLAVHTPAVDYNPDLPSTDKYGYRSLRGIQDPSITDSTLEDIRNEDARNMVIQQDTTWILGTIASATLLIAAIMIARE